MDGFAIASSELPSDFIDKHALRARMHERGGQSEIRFMRRMRQAVLPVLHAGQLLLAPWGSKHPALPRSGFTWQSTVEAGEWSRYHGEQVTIPASAGLHNGVWYRIRQGVSGVLICSDEMTAVYVVVRQSTYYYRIMTRGTRMPVLVGEVI
jgi:hypothetical protein